jgi:hypothetical protein
VIAFTVLQNASAFVASLCVRCRQYLLAHNELVLQRAVAGEAVLFW